MPCLLFLANFVAWTATTSDRVRELRRYGEDMSVATTAYLERLRPTAVPPVELSSAVAQRYGLDLLAYMLEAEQSLGLRPWQFWRTLPSTPPARPGRIVHRSNDDVGRARLTELGFRLLAGVAPFLPPWLAALFCLPVLAWMAWELTQAGHALAGAAFGTAFACSPFIVESMALSYSAFGFYLVGLLAVGAFAVHATMQPPDARGFLWRALALGPLLALCTLCRDGTLLLFPGLLLAVLWGARRILAAPSSRVAGPRRRRALFVLLGVAAAALPGLLVHPSTHHELWTGVWEGLGDFDRTKGHVWSDRVALRLLLDAGLDPGVPSEVEIFDRDLSSPEKEGFFRRLVFRDVRSDPLWFLAILGRRVVATVTQDQLLLLGGRADPSVQARRGPRAPIPTNQGRIRFFYRLVTTADWVGCGRWRVPLPLGALWGAGAAFLYAAVSDRARRGPRSACALLASVACAALALPVLVTTAGALETQAFMLVYLIALAFVLESVWRGVTRLLRAATGPGDQPRT